MKIAIIYPPFFHKKFNENLPTVDDEFGLFPHIGFGWVAAAVKQAGHEVKLFDAAVSKCHYESVLRDVRAYNPDVLGFAAHAIQTYRDMLVWAKKFKKDMGLPVLVGGYEAKIYPAEIMEHSCFDFLCAGEFIKQFLAGSALLGVAIFFPQKDRTARFLSLLSVCYLLLVLISREKRVHYISPLVLLSTVVAVRMLMWTQWTQIRAKLLRL